MNRVEMRLILRSRLAVASLALLFVLSALAIVSGLANVARQEAAIARAAAAQASDFTTVAADYGKPDGEAGYAAYYTFLLTTDRPPPLAFAAIGQRDVQPATLRIRALGLQQQLYDSETLNAALALPGVFDWAFVAVYLAPLVVIALAHDLVSGEREAGRLRLLLSMPASGAALWRRRVGLRYALVLAALLLPPLIAFVATGAPLLLATGMLAVAAIYLAFWFGLCLAIGARIAASATNAAALVGCWIALTLLLPTLANAAIARAVPVGKGIELTLAQREVVHKGWDIPKAATFDKFLVDHPEYRGREAFEGRFHWKWYYAIHQVGDEAVAPQVAAYRKSLEERERWTARAGWLLPSVATQVLLHRLADTDLTAQTAYWDSITAFHDVLRRFFYPYFFDDRPFTAADFAKLPGYQPRASTAGWPAGSTAALLLVTLIVLAIGAVQVRRMGAPERVAH
jgi:ABC-2 type transport system permease protein